MQDWLIQKSSIRHQKFRHQKLKFRMAATAANVEIEIKSWH